MIIENDLQWKIVVERREAVSPHYRLRHVADSSRIGFQRMQQPKQRLSCSPQRRDGRGEPPSDDTTRSLLPGDRNQGAERVRGGDTEPFVPRKHRYVMRPDYQGGFIIFGVTGLKLECSSLNTEKEKKNGLSAVLYKAKHFAKNCLCTEEVSATKSARRNIDLAIYLVYLISEGVDKHYMLKYVLNEIYQPSRY